MHALATILEFSWKFASRYKLAHSDFVVCCKLEPGRSPFASLKCPVLALESRLKLPLVNLASAETRGQARHFAHRGQCSRRLGDVNVGDQGTGLWDFDRCDWGRPLFSKGALKDYDDAIRVLPG